jgi:predicted metal-dependent hydrolase
VTERALLAEAARLFNDKLYFEAHDYLEDAWRDARGDERAFLQALIHVSVGMYHVAATNHQGAVNLLSRGVDALAPFAPETDGLDVGGLVAQASVCLDKSRRLLAGEAVAWTPEDVPRMELVPAE